MTKTPPNSGESILSEALTLAWASLGFTSRDAYRVSITCMLWLCERVCRACGRYGGGFVSKAGQGASSGEFSLLLASLARAPSFLPLFPFPCDLLHQPSQHTQHRSAFHRELLAMMPRDAGARPHLSLPLLLLSITLTLLPTSTLALSNGLGLTPAMGFNTWNKFGCNIDEAMVRETAQLLIDTGLRDKGYVYVNLDDCWMERNRTTDGRLVEDPVKFPSGLKALGDYLHGLGFKFGIYSSAGYATCEKYPASLGRGGREGGRERGREGGRAGRFFTFKHDTNE